MRNCVLSSDLTSKYNPSTEFVSYVIEEKSGSRYLALQYQRGKSDEQFLLMKLALMDGSTTPGMFTTDQRFRATVNIVSGDDLVNMLIDEGNRYHMNIVPKVYLEGVINTFEGIDFVRSSNAASALKFITDKIKAAVSIEINPVELTLNVAERLSVKKAEGRCLIL